LAKREIVHIDEELCNGCGQCIPNCHEGALKIIDGKARLVSDLFCDGLGACIGHCPMGAISIEKRQAEPYDEKKVMESMVPKGSNTVKAHLLHLKEHGALDLFEQGVQFLHVKKIPIPSGVLVEEKLACGCCADQVKSIECNDEPVHGDRRNSRLQTWPVQLHLVPPHAPYLNNADILLAADCVPFAYPEFHEDFLKGRIALIGCPKLDDVDAYQEKLTAIFKQNRIKSVTAVHMEVPCCFGLTRLVQKAIAASGKEIRLNDVTISVKGEIKE
jgi:NAD-dependent dihydropyrimidine dehydrogenase PreA subunit